MNIDWSKAPEDATHAGNSPYEKGVVTWFKGISDPTSRNHFMNAGSMNAWAISSENLSAWYLIERPKKQEAWDGDGLPPVGTVCEVLWNESRAEYLRTKVFGVNEHGQPIHRFDEGPKKYQYQADVLRTASGTQVFRPIRTAEQVAAEEWDKARTEALNAMSANGKTANEPEALWKFRLKVLGEMLDMGYRKQ